MWSFMQTQPWRLIDRATSIPLWNLGPRKRKTKHIHMLGAKRHTAYSRNWVRWSFFCNFHANATVKVDRQSDFTCNHLCLSASWENSTKVDGKAHLLCNLTHAANVQHTCNTRATQRATRAFLLQIPMIFARRCKICSFSFWSSLGTPKVGRKPFWL